jgi:two-component system, OmpR family, KDP operon response regulator KdpE
VTLVESQSSVDVQLVPRQPPTHPGARVLVVEGDSALARLIQRKLRRHGLSCEPVSSARDARRALDRLRPDLVLLDLDLADSAAWDLITDIRSRTAVPILAMSSPRGERHTVAALDLGADDYVTKPLGFEELRARIRVALRHVARPESGAEPVLRVGNLVLDIERRLVLRAGLPVHVTPTEYQLLKLFATHPDRLLTDRMLMNAVWGPGWRGGEHILHVYVARLRKKVEDDPAAPRFLVTESGLGYCFASSDSSNRDTRVRPAVPV